MSMKQNDETQERWYMVNKDGMCTLCADQADAEQAAVEAQDVWPHMGPHRAVRLVEVGDAGFTAADIATAEARGFRDGQAEELAAMRAGGEPVAEMVPCYTPSGKRVAVISRFQHLPIGTKLYTHPQPAAQDAEDAKRYRWLRRNAIGAFRTNDGKGPVSVYHLCKIPAIPGIPEETDAAIDAAIAAQQGDSHE